MLKLQEGKYYKRRDGFIAGPAKIKLNMENYFTLDTKTYRGDGKCVCPNSSSDVDIIEEVILTQPFDPYAEVMPAWGMLTPDQQQMIKDNGPWQMYRVDGWRDLEEPLWTTSMTYRSKPKPKPKALTTEEKLNAKLSKALEALRKAGITLKEIEGE
jgi:hypothetical protein